MLSHAHFKAGKSFQYRILCGKPNAQGCRNRRGELGRLLLKDEGGYLFATPVISATMARDAQGVYRMARQRRPHRSGIEGDRYVGGGVTTAHLLHDKQGNPLKMLQPLYGAEGHDRMVMACPRCHAANEVHLDDLVSLMERTGLTSRSWHVRIPFYLERFAAPH